MAFHQSWVWWECGREPVLQLYLVHHDPEPCPTIWARWCEWRFWQQGMCSGVNLLHCDRFSSQYRGSTSRLGQSHRDSRACSPAIRRHSCMSLRDWELATARDVYIWQPMDSPPELTLERRFNFLVRILAATKGHLRATLVAKVEWDIWRALESLCQ